MTGSLDNIHPDLLRILTNIEQTVGMKLHVTSGYRTPEHNAQVGGVIASEHTYTPAHAVDIACTNGSERWILVNLAIKHGIVRLGVGKDFVHLGMAPDKPQRVIWVYKS